MRNFLRNFLLLTIANIACLSFVYAEMTADIKLYPLNPVPNSSVTLTLESYSFNVDTATISWKVNGITTLEGFGQKVLKVPTGGIGETLQVSVRADLADGSYLEQAMSVTPASVVLLYEAPKSYVPPLYEGRSLPSEGGLVRVTALPQISDNGIPVPPSSLSYTWYLNGNIMKSVSGTAKQSANIRLDFLRSRNEIKVVIRSPFGNIATNKIEILPHPVMPLLYTYDPVLGTNFTKNIGKRFETTKDFTLILEPFYISRNDPGEPSYTWFLNNLPATPINGRILSLNPKENTYGTKLLTIKTVGPDKRLQKGELSSEIIFDTRK